MDSDPLWPHTASFEVSVDGELIFSKLKKGKFPKDADVSEMLLKKNPSWCSKTNFYLNRSFNVHVTFCVNVLLEIQNILCIE